MTDEHKGSYARQFASWAERARKAKGRVTHVTWHRGEMFCEITPGRTAPPQAAEPVFVNRRGLLI